MKRFLRKFIPVRQSEELKTLLARAEELAKSYAHDYVGVEHAFLCLRDLPPDHSLRSIVAQFPFDIAGFWEDLEREARVVTGRPVPSFLPYTPRLQQVLRIAIRTTKFSGESRVTLPHFFGAIAREGNSLVAHVFRRHLANKKAERSYHETAATYFTVLMTFPEVTVFAPQTEPNKALVPTPASVTPAAGAPVAPDAGAAHL